MKTNKYYIVAIFTLLSLSACQKDEPRVNFNLRVADHYDSGDSKVWMNGQTPVFVEDEAVRINGETYLIDHRNGSPAVYDVAEADAYYAIYPASWVNGNASATPSITFPDMQKYEIDATSGEQIVENPMVAYTTEGGATLNFRNVAALANVHIKNEYGSALKIKYVALYTDDTYLCGDGTITGITGSTPSVSISSGITNVSIDCSELPTLNDGKTADVTFALPPISGVKLYVDVYMTSTDGSTKYSFTKETASGKTIGRNQMGDINVTLRQSGDDAVATCGLFWGTGVSEADPFIIMDKADLTHLKEQVAAGSSTYNDDGVYYLQTANIDLTSETDWTGIGTSSHPFVANYDGSEAWVKLNIDNVSSSSSVSANDGVGLFGCVSGGGFIKNLTTKGAVAPQSKNVYVGGIVGKVVGSFTFDKCINRVSLTTNGSASTFYCSPYGGICGWIRVPDETVTIRNCENWGNLTQDKYSSIGGICGAVHSGTVDFVSNINHGTLTGNGLNDTTATGGILGYLRGGTVTFTTCSNEGSVSTNRTGVGGICGYCKVSTVTFTSCTNSGPVTSTAQGAGGIVGYGSGDLTINGTGTKNTGAIKGTTLVGGIVGSASHVYINATSGKTINEGTVTGSGNNGSSNGIGGIVGSVRNGDTKNCIINCWNKGSVTSTGTVAAGGIVGYTGQCTINRCKNTGNIDVASGGGNGYAAAGGIVGISNGGSTINIYNCGVECVDICTATISTLRYTGGIVGYGRDNYNITNCYVQVTSMYGSSSTSSPYGSAAGIFGLLCTSHTVKMINVYTYFYANSGNKIRPTIHNTTGTVTTTSTYCNSNYAASPSSTTGSAGYPTAYFSTSDGSATTGSFYNDNTTLGDALRDYRNNVLGSTNYISWTTGATPKLDWVGTGIFSSTD